MIGIAGDHGGFELKKEILKYFNDRNIDVLDLGTDNMERTDYPLYAKKMADKIEKGSITKGILICKSGHGMNIAANKFKGVYASICYSEESAIKAVEDDNINVCVLSSDDISLDEAIKIIHIFLDRKLKTDDTRYLERFKMLEEFEKENFK